MSVRVVDNPLAAPVPASAQASAEPLAFHRRLPGYAPTPLVEAPALAERLGVQRLLVKCELERFGLPAFKMLGASWATYRALGGPALGQWETVDDLARLLDGRRPLTLAAATDGNHGRAVARMARLLGLGARIFVPQGTAEARIAAIEAEGAGVEVVDGDYDAAVARSAAVAEGDERCLVISDTTWPGYEDVPRWVVEGYSTLFFELDGAPGASPDVVVVPVGVGGLAAAAVAYWAGGEQRPYTVGVEPVGAACVLESAMAGRMVTMAGPHPSIMAGLNCGTPSSVAWPLVSAGFDAFVEVGDEWAEAAMRDLAAVGVAAGETGAAALAGFTAARAAGRLAKAGGTVLVLCTEGVTDPEADARIV